MIPTKRRTYVRSLPAFQLSLFGAILVSALAFVTTPASAVINSSVRKACMSDYFAYCAGMEVGSKELRRCMNKAGPKLQPSCVSALVAAGEVSQAEVSRRGQAGASKVAKAKAAKPGKRAGKYAAKSKPGKRQYAYLR